MQSEKDLEKEVLPFRNQSEITDQEIREATLKSFSVREVLDAINVDNGGTNYQWYYSKIKDLAIDISHFNSYQKIINKPKKLNLNDLLVENSSFLNTVSLKKKLYAAKMLEAKCVECGITDWCGKPISLHLDHINGIPNDNRIENLRILCPICHEQIGKKYLPNKVGRKSLQKKKAQKLNSSS